MERKVRKRKKNSNPNLSKGKRKAIEELTERNDITITSGHKSGAVVIKDIDKYISGDRGQLCDKHRCNTVSLSMTQVRHLKKKICFLKKWPTDSNPSVPKRQNHTFCQL